MTDNYIESCNVVYDMIEELMGKNFLTPDLRNQMAMGIVDQILELYGIEDSDE